MEFCPLSFSQTKGFKETLSSSSQEINSSTLSAGSSRDDTVILEIMSCNSDDTIILEESDSPSNNRASPNVLVKEIFFVIDYSGTCCVLFHFYVYVSSVVKGLSTSQVFELVVELALMRRPGCGGGAYHQRVPPHQKSNQLLTPTNDQHTCGWHDRKAWVIWFSARKLETLENCV